MKNLENEYRKITEENVPDLWDRIEAGIDKLEAEKEATSISNTADNKKVVSIKKKKTVNRIVPILVAAAALLLSIGLFTMSNSGIVKTTDSAASTGMSAAPAMADADAASDTMNFAPEMVEEAAAAMDEEPAMAEEAAPVIMDEAPAEAMNDINYEEAEKSRENIAAGEAKEIIEQNEYYGSVTVCENPKFAEIVMKDGNIIKLYVPSEYFEALNEAETDGLKLYITYEEIDSELKNSFPEDYSDTMYQIVNLKY